MFERGIHSYGRCNGRQWVGTENMEDKKGEAKGHDSHLQDDGAMVGDWWLSDCRSVVRDGWKWDGDDYWSEEEMEKEMMNGRSNCRIAKGGWGTGELVGMEKKLMNGRINIWKIGEVKFEK